MRRARRGAIALALSWAASGCMAANRPSGFSSVPVRQGEFVVDVHAPGVVFALDSTAISTPQGVWGDIEAIAPEGSYLKKGAFLARISVRDLQDDLRNKQTQLIQYQGDLARGDANAPVKRGVIEQEILAHRRDWQMAEVTRRTTAQGGQPEQLEGARRDVTVAELAVKNNALPQKQSLYRQGVIATAEYDQARLDARLAEVTRARAGLNLAGLLPGAQTDDIERTRLLASKARAAFEGTKLEAPAKAALIKLDHEKGQVQIDQMQKNITRLSRRIHSAVLSAPSDGYVLYPTIWNWKKIAVGMRVWEGLNFLQLARLDALKVVANVSERDVGNVKVGAPVEISADGFPGRVFPGTVQAISKLAKELEGDQATSGVKSFEVTVHPDRATPELKPNMTVSLRVIARRVASASAIPQDALFGSPTARYIWLDGERGPAKTPVTPTFWSADWVAVKETLGPGARVYLLDPTAKSPEATGSPAPDAPDASRRPAGKRP